MTLSEVKKRVLKTLDLVISQEKPNLRLVQDCIDCIRDNGFEEVLSEGYQTLQLAYSVGLEINESEKKIKESERMVEALEDELKDTQYLIDYLNNIHCKDEKKEECPNSSLTFKVEKTQNGLKINLTNKGLNTVELLSTIELLRKEIEKIV